MLAIIFTIILPLSIIIILISYFGRPHTHYGYRLLNIPPTLDSPISLIFSSLSIFFEPDEKYSPQSIELRSKLNPNSKDPEIKLYLKRQKPRRGYEVVGKDEGTDGQKTITEYQEAHTGKWSVKSKLIRAGYTEEDLEEMRQREIRKKHKPKPKNTEKTMFNHNGRLYGNKP